MNLHSLEYPETSHLHLTSNYLQNKKNSKSWW